MCHLPGILSSSSKTKPVASVSGQASGCCITPTGYRSHRVVTNGVQPLNLSQVSLLPSGVLRTALGTCEAGRKAGLQQDR